MRVLYVADNVRDPRKGASGADLALLGGLRARGHDVDEVWDVSAPRRIAHGNLHLLLEAPWKCDRAIRERRRTVDYDAVLVNQPLAYRAARRHRREARPGVFVGRSHGWEPHVTQEMARWAPARERSAVRRAASTVLLPLLARQNELLARHCDGLVVGSMDDFEWLVERGFDRDRLVAVPPGLPPQALEAPSTANDPARWQKLLYVGQHAPVKAPDVVAGIASTVLQARPEASMTWVCESAAHDRARALLSPSVLSRVTFLDWMDRASLVRVYDAHGIYLFPSYFEGFGQTFLEAMARGLVVLASRVGGMRQSIRDGHDGFLFERGDADAPARTAMRLFEDVGTCRRVSNAARETAAGFTWARSAALLDDFLSKLLERARTRNAVVA